MAVLLLGAVLIAAGALSIRFPELCTSLRSEDPEQWKLLGSPRGYSFSDLGQTSGVFSWVLSRGFESSSSSRISALGEQAYARALCAKYALLGGLVFLLIGFGLSLAGIWV